MYDLHRLRLLRELKYRGTLAAVAAALSYSPSSVSQQLSQLESEVGVTLLEPVGRRVRLTTQAEILVAHTNAVLERLEQAEADIANTCAGLAGTLRIASFQTAAFALVPTALTLLRQAHPQLRVHVAEEEPETALPALLARDYDLVVTEEYPGNPNGWSTQIDEEVLCDDPLRLAVPNAMEAVKNAAGQDALRALADHPWAMEPRDSAARQWAVQLCHAAGFKPDVRFETADVLLRLRLVEEGHAAALLPDLIWTDRRPTIALRTLPPGGQTRRLFTAVRRGRSQHPTIQACRQALLQAARSAAAGARTSR